MRINQVECDLEYCWPVPVAQLSQTKKLATIERVKIFTQLEVTNEVLSDDLKSSTCPIDRNVYRLR